VGLWPRTPTITIFNLKTFQATINTNTTRTTTAAPPSSTLPTRTGRTLAPPLLRRLHAPAPSSSAQQDLSPPRPCRVGAGPRLGRRRPRSLRDTSPSCMLLSPLPPRRRSRGASGLQRPHSDSRRRWRDPSRHQSHRGSSPGFLTTSNSYRARLLLLSGDRLSHSVLSTTIFSFCPTL
jgi:hypothetical protein